MDLSSYVFLLGAVARNAPASSDDLIVAADRMDDMDSCYVKQRRNNFTPMNFIRFNQL